LLVQTTTRGGPAAEAGIKGGDRVAQAGMRRFYVGGDVLTAIDGQKVTTPLEVNVALNKKRPGDTVTVTLFRGGKKMDIPVKLGERPGS
jgi:S1-C subfamily serine protease